MGLLMIDGQTIHTNDDIELLPTDITTTAGEHDPPDGDFGLHFSPMEYTIEMKVHPHQLRRLRRYVLGWKAKGPMRTRQVWKARKLQTQIRVCGDEVWE